MDGIGGFWLLLRQKGGGANPKRAKGDLAGGWGGGWGGGVRIERISGVGGEKLDSLRPSGKDF